MMKRWMRIVGWIVVGLTSLFYIQSGVQKLAGTEEMIRHFQDIGYPDWSRILIGLVEIAGAVLLVWPRLTLYAATALGLLMIGAVVSELSAGQGFGTLMAAQWLVVLVLIAGVRLRIVFQSKSKSKCVESHA